jgi:hypothetical protein
MQRRYLGADVPGTKLIGTTYLTPSAFGAQNARRRHGYDGSQKRWSNVDDTIVIDTFQAVPRSTGTRARLSSWGSKRSAARLWTSPINGVSICYTTEAK